MLEPTRTPLDTLLRGYEIAKRVGLRHVYAGNAAGAVGDRENTTCTQCGATLIRRLGFTVLENRMSGHACPDCAAVLPGVWEENPAPLRRKAAWPLALRMC
jgi:pyruvate formate lyase activating enzyme